MKSENTRDHSSMSSLAGKKETTKYMGGGSEAMPSKGTKTAVHHIIADHNNHSSGYASAHHRSASTKHKK